MNHPDWKGNDYQNGILRGYTDVKDLICSQQKGKCLLCKNQIEHYHHIIPRSKRGSNTAENIAGLCKHCHELVHKEKSIATKLATKKQGLNKKFHALTAMNQAMPSILNELVILFGENHVHPVLGWETKNAREDAHFADKTKENPMHAEDAYIIACLGESFRIAGVENSQPFMIKQYRRHNRAIIKSQTERTYKLDGKVVAKNRRKRTEQKEDSLHEWYIKTKQAVGILEARRLQSKLVVTKSTRRYNDSKRLLPGTVFNYAGEEHILSGRLSNGQYYRAAGDTKTNFRAKYCHTVKQNTGLVFVR